MPCAANFLAGEVALCAQTLHNGENRGAGLARGFRKVLGDFPDPDGVVVCDVSLDLKLDLAERLMGTCHVTLL